MPRDTLGLAKLVPRGRGYREPLFTDEEWEEVAAARERGVSWPQIQDVTKRFKNHQALSGSFTTWKRRQAKDRAT